MEPVKEYPIAFKYFMCASNLTMYASNDEVNWINIGKVKEQSANEYANDVIFYDGNVSYCLPEGSHYRYYGIVGETISICRKNNSLKDHIESVKKTWVADYTVNKGADHVCEWVDYNGFTESYRYCKHCNKKYE